MAVVEPLALIGRCRCVDGNTLHLQNKVPFAPAPHREFVADALIDEDLATIRGAALFELPPDARIVNRSGVILWDEVENRVSASGALSVNKMAGQNISENH